MSFRITACCALATLFSHISFADVTLQVPDNISVQVVNQERPELESNILGGEKTLILPNGTNQILFQFIPMFVGREDVEKVYSKHIIAKFNAKNTNLSFDLPSYKNERQANAEIDNLKWALIDEAGKKVLIEEDYINLRGVTLGRDYIRDVEKYNKTDGVAAVKTTTSHFETPEIQPSNLTQMEFLQQQYLKMSQQDRKAFLQWAVSQ
ncbi:DUF2057 family protein [Vibrio olivae]|uniref:DUF2057 family protein n=1 Tax=Vibrio olivae TaxID=1243002 RepID=A0ABV5HJL4_9VIBR